MNRLVGVSRVVGPQARRVLSSRGTRAFSSWSPKKMGMSTAAVESNEETCGVFANEAEWEAAFLEATAEVRSDLTHAESAAAMRKLDKLGLLKHTDLRDRPDRFFKAHRLLARHAVAHGPGFWIRFTVHHNLCYGTVLAVGNEAQIESLDALQDRGELGCFALTERLAGVQSGLVVQTTAEFDAATREFILNTPAEGATKNWISQGFTADNAVVLASLTVAGERKGPHAFLMKMRDAAGKLTPGVSVGDMGVKTTGNDLDNAWIQFDKVRVPREALLAQHCEVDDAGEYRLLTQGVKPFEMIGQRLYTGRVAVAQAALAYRAKLFEVTKAYTDAKLIPNVVNPKQPKPLSSIPQLKALYAEADATAAKLDAFVGECEARLAPLLKQGAPPDANLALAIATAKVKAVEHSIDLCHRLKQEVGSYALMGTSGFVHIDFLNCCKFAEGDSRILMLKMARDKLRDFAKADPARRDAQDEETKLCLQLAAKLAQAKGDKAREAEIFDEEWLTVYALAEAVMNRVMRNFAL